MEKSEHRQLGLNLNAALWRMGRGSRVQGGPTGAQRVGKGTNLRAEPPEGAEIEEQRADLTGGPQDWGAG